MGNSKFKILEDHTMAVTKKSLISNSASKKSTKKSKAKAAAPAITAAKMATAVTFAKKVGGMNPTLKVI